MQILGDLETHPLQHQAKVITVEPVVEPLRAIKAAAAEVALVPLVRVHLERVVGSLQVTVARG